MTKIFGIKAEIKDFVRSGSPPVIRRGSKHFLPNTEVLGTFMFDSVTPRLEVRGMHKSGIYVTIPVHLNYLKNIRLEEIDDTETEFYRFVNNEGVYYRFELNRWMNWFKKIINRDALEEQKIKDPLFLSAKNFVQELKKLAETDQLDRICQYHISYPIEIQWRKESKHLSEFLSKRDFVEKRPWQIEYELKESIMRTDIETIFPINGEMVLGFLKVSITKDYQFKIVKIHTERKRIKN